MLGFGTSRAAARTCPAGISTVRPTGSRLVADRDGLYHDRVLAFSFRALAMDASVCPFLVVTLVKDSRASSGRESNCA